MGTYTYIQHIYEISVSLALFKCREISGSTSKDKWSTEFALIFIILTQILQILNCKTPKSSIQNDSKFQFALSTLSIFVPLRSWNTSRVAMLPTTRRFKANTVFFCFLQNNMFAYQLQLVGEPTFQAHYWTLGHCYCSLNNLTRFMLYLMYISILSFSKKTPTVATWWDFTVGHFLFSLSFSPSIPPLTPVLQRSVLLLDRDRQHYLPFDGRYLQHEWLKRARDWVSKPHINLIMQHC